MSTVKGLRLSEEKWRRITKAAAANGQSRNNWIETLLDAELERCERLQDFAGAIDRDHVDRQDQP